MKLNIIRSILPPPLGINHRKPLFVLTGHRLTVAAHDAKGIAPPKAELIPAETGGVAFHIDNVLVSDALSQLRVTGWAFPSGGPLLRRATTLVLSSDEHAYSWPTEPVGRPDLRDHYGAQWIYHCGFWARVDMHGLPPGEYRVGLSLDSPDSLIAGARRAIRDLDADCEKQTPAIPFVRTVQDLDAEIELLQEVRRTSWGQWLGLRNAYQLFEDTSKLPADPLSKEYRQAQLDLYSRVSGKSEYSAWSSEPIPIAIDASGDPYPFPFSTKDPEYIGNHLLNIGHIFRTLHWLQPPGRAMLEYGCGDGFTTVILAASGYDMTAVDINAQALAALDRHARERKLTITTFNGVFGQVPDENRKYDVVLFYESFHHCLDFPELLGVLHSRINDGGGIIFAGEPIFADFPKPWGLRLDGSALWEIRTRGWLELGFNEKFFFELLEKHGWIGSKRTSEFAADIFVARKKPLGA